MKRRSFLLLLSCAAFTLAVIVPLRMLLGSAFTPPAGERSTRHVADDVDGDGAAEIVLFGGNGWKIVGARDGNEVSFALGSSASIPVLADYDGDGRTDFGFYVPEFQPPAGKTENWEIWLGDAERLAAGRQPAVREVPLRFSWGLGGHVPVPADYDGDGRSDLAVWDPKTGKWHVAFMKEAVPNFAKASLNLRESGIVRQWGLPGDRPVPADYDGDKRVDFAVVRGGGGTGELSWYIAYQTGEEETVVFGKGSEVPLPADYDGDGKADLAVFGPAETAAEALGEWVIRTGKQKVDREKWCRAGFMPVVRDWDGDGRADLGCFAPELSPPWEILLSSVSAKGRELFADKGPGVVTRKAPVAGYRVSSCCR